MYYFKVVVREEPDTYHYGTMTMRKRKLKKEGEIVQKDQTRVKRKKTAGNLKSLKLSLTTVTRGGDRGW